MNGRIMISKVTTNADNVSSYAKVEIHTADLIVKVEMSMEDFAHLILGQLMPCEVSVKDKK